MSTSNISFTATTKGSLEGMMKNEYGSVAAISENNAATSFLVKHYKHKCDWKIIPETLFKSYAGPAIPRHSPYTHVFNKA